jgi:SAM-dependent methyltransferase
MDRATVSAIAHGDLELLNPLSPAQLDEVVELLDLPRGARVLDVGCGRGEALLRIAHRWGARGVGIDSHEPYVAHARRRATEQGAELELHAADAATFAYERGGYDLAMTIGSSHALGGDFRAALGELAALARPGGQVLLGEGYWRREPDEQYLAALGASRDELSDYAGVIGAGAAAGLVPLYAAVAQQTDWDRYEWRLILNSERYAAAHAGEPGTNDVAERARAARERYLAPGGRDTLGFGLFLFARPVG